MYNQPLILHAVCPVAFHARFSGRRCWARCCCSTVVQQTLTSVLLSLLSLHAESSGRRCWVRCCCIPIAKWPTLHICCLPCCLCMLGHLGAAAGCAVGAVRRVRGPSPHQVHSGGPGGRLQPHGDGKWRVGLGTMLGDRDVVWGWGWESFGRTDSRLQPHGDVRWRLDLPVWPDRISERGSAMQTSVVILAAGFSPTHLHSPSTCTAYLVSVALPHICFYLFLPLHRWVCQLCATSS